jgi:hypothetical protein
MKKKNSNELWYDNPTILIESMHDYFPANHLSQVEKINALARFAIYYAIIIILGGFNTQWLSISIVLLLVSFFLGISEPFEGLIPDNNETCQHPTKNNPFMNYTLGDQIANPKRKEACDYKDVKVEVDKAYKSHLFADKFDVFGAKISDRNFYIMPNTKSINKQTEFAEWCYDMKNECKETGTSCHVLRDPETHKGRLVKINE